MGDILRGGRQEVQEQITREEVGKAITRLRGGKPPRCGWNKCRNAEVWRGCCGGVDVTDM